MQRIVRALSSAELSAIRDYHKSQLPIICAPGSTATTSIDCATNAVNYKPVIYFSRSANRQRIISSNFRGIKKAAAIANRIIYLPAD